MFGGMGDPMDVDPNTIQDWDKMKNQESVDQFAVAEGQATLGSIGLPPDQASNGKSSGASFEAAGVLPKVQGIMDKVSTGMKDSSDAVIKMQQEQMKQQLAKGKISQQLFNAQMSQLAQTRRAGFLQRNTSILAVGALLVAGGVLLYYMTRRRRYR